MNSKETSKDSSLRRLEKNKLFSFYPGKIKKYFLYSSILFVFFCPRTLLAGYDNYTSPLLQPLNDMGGSARVMAMGSAFVGVADDTSALLWNPAGLGQLKQCELALHHNSWLVGTDQESLVAGLPVNGLGGFGVMVSYLDYGTFQGRDSTGALTSPYSADRLGFMAGWGMELISGLYFGLGAEENQQFNPNQSYGVLSGELGVLYTPDHHLKFGAALINFGGNQLDAWVATAIEAGASYQQNFGMAHSLLLTLSGTLEPQGVNRLGVGAEYGFQSNYFLRAGYQVSQQNNELGGLTGLTAGAGIRWNDLELDYAYLPYGDLGTSNRVSLSYFFPTSKDKTTVSKPISQGAMETGQPAGTFKPNAGTQNSQKVLTLQFDVPPADLVSQGQALDAQGRMTEAMKLYEEELKQDSRNSAAWYYLGADYDKLKQKAYAVQCFEEVLKLNPTDKALADWLELYKSKP
jgi:tetratricopeptide (TPR) repeat protein